MIYDNKRKLENKFNPPNNLKNKDKKDINITVSSVQLKNPILKDFFFGYNIENDKEKSCLYDFKILDKFYCFFLSMKYHEAYPSYLEEKLSNFHNKTLNKNYFKYLFCILDFSDEDENSKIKNLKEDKLFNLNLNIACNESINLEFQTKNGNLKPNSKLENILTDLNFICMNNNTAFILCYSGYDMAQYIYSLSRLDSTDFAEEKIKNLNLEENLVETLCCIEKLNKNDASNLLRNFKDIKSVCAASEQLLTLVPGINEKKIKSIDEFFKYSFSNFNN